MATTTLQHESASATQPASPSAEAFMRAFREFHRIDNETGDTDTPEYQLAMYAFEGAKERAVFMAHNHDEGALAALAAFDKAESILGGAFSVGGGPLADDDLRSELRAIQEALRNLWRYHDRAGGTIARPFAEYIGAAERRDRVAWQEA